MSYLDLTIEEIHQALITKKVTPLQLVKEAIQRAKDNKDNAFEYIDEKNAIERASLLTEPNDNLFWGIPYVAKDNFSTKGVPTTASSNILNGYVPLFDATVIEKLNNAGAIMIGKTTLDELAMGGTGTSGHKGITYNPFDRNHNHLIGGSSCGSAVAVCDNIVPFALGSDTGDSVRKPASNAGLVGFKPTWGRISRYGLFPFAPSLDHVAYFTRSVNDSAIALTLLEGHDDKDMTSSFKQGQDYIKAINGNYKNYKIAIIKPILDSINNQEIKKCFLESVNNLKARGVIIEEIDFDLDLLKAIYPIYNVISCAEATSNNANLDGIKFGPRFEGNTYQEVMKNARTKGFSSLIKRRFVIGSYALMKENQNELFLRAQKGRRKIVDEINKIFENYDFIYLPASPNTAPLINDSSDALSNEYLIADNHLAIGNFGGFPSLTLPIGLINGLPIGANITGRPFEEGKVFNICSLIEKTTNLKNLNARTKGDK